jgi:hypothetical protein
VLQGIEVTVFTAETETLINSLRKKIVLAMPLKCCVHVFTSSGDFILST